MTGVEAAWWLLFFTALGLCIGSFLNVVIFRLPRDLSLSDPLWSFCPGCDARIRWYDNLPLLSFIRLGGRCRNCRTPISLRYPLVEMLAALTVVMLLDAFCIARTRMELTGDALGLTWQLSSDWPILIAHIVLFAALLAMSAIDIEHYWVDINFTHAATLAGFALHAIWRPERFGVRNPPSPGWGAAALVAAGTTLLMIVILSLFRRHEAPPPEPEPAPVAPPSADTPAIAVVEPPAPPAGSIAQPASELVVEPTPMPAVQTPAAETPPSPTFSVARVAALMSGISLLIVLVGAWLDAIGFRSPFIMPAARWMPALSVFMLVIIGLAAARRESDHAIVAEIEAERGSARGMALRETLALLPAAVLGGVTLYYGLACGNTQAMFSQVLAWSPTGDWRPLQGLADAALGFVIAGATGWLVRILGTLALGREAFGAGDIHMMAAAGCVAGWQVALIGFVLCSLLALVGWIVTLPFKRARAIPLGPWLSLAFLVVVIFYDPIIHHWPIDNIVYLFQHPELFKNLTGQY